MPLEHRDWGKATLVAPPDPPVPPAGLVDMDCRLTADEKEAVKSCRSSVMIGGEPRTGNVLSDRKDLLRFLHAVLGADGIAAIDHSAQAFWSGAGLEDELAHAADLDVDAIYSLHLLADGPPAEGRLGSWLHSHGLREVGFFDFDVLDPGVGLEGHAHEVVRAIAFAILEERLDASGRPFELVAGEQVGAVEVSDFLARARSSDHGAYRALVDDDHVHGHAVLCDPSPAGWLSRLLRGAAPRPSRFLRGPLPDEVLIGFSDAATDLMARRARQTIEVFRDVAGEVAEFELPSLVKLGYPVDGGAADAREHLWFQVHAFDGDSVDATLVNAPFHVARLRQGERGCHPLELLSDWTILTPFGQVNPRQTRTLRFLRDHREELREAIAETPGSPAARA